MPAPRRRDRRTASSRDSVEVRRLLQRDADTFIAVERRTQASGCAAAESGQSGEGAARRWTASRIPAAGGMRPIGRISGRHRLDVAKQAFRDAGAELKAFYLVTGQYDAVAISEAPNNETVAKLSLRTAAMGNVRTETLRAFNEEEYRRIVASIG